LRSKKEKKMFSLFVSIGFELKAVKKIYKNIFLFLSLGFEL